MARIYFDLDGVLADFVAALPDKDLYYSLYRHRKPKIPVTDVNKTKDDFWHSVQDIAGFWENLPEVKGAKKMVELAEKSGAELFVLSATPNPIRLRQPNTDIPYIESAKVKWVLSHFGEFFKQENIIITTSISKAGVITPTASDILIDDSKRGIDAWNSAGGHGILFLSVKQVMKEFNSLIKKRFFFLVKITASEDMELQN